MKVSVLDAIVELSSVGMMEAKANGDPGQQTYI